MPVFLLIRHGENDYVKKRRLAGRLPGVHLNKKGQKQAQMLAEMLAKAPVKAIYSSPLERTLETAEPLAKALDMQVVPNPGLIEVDCGEWQDQSLGKLRRTKSWKLVQSAPSRFGFPGGESFAAAQLRITNEIHSLAAQYEPKDMIICVSHSDPIRLAIAYFIGLPLDMFQRLQISPASISTLFIGQGGSSLISMNQAPSLITPTG